MAAVQCSIDKGNVTVAGGSLIECNSTSVSRQVALLQASGSTTTNFVVVQDSKIQVELDGLLVRSGAPFTVTSSTVSVVLTGATNLSATGSGSAGIGCHAMSNLSFSELSLNGGSLAARGGEEGALGPAETRTVGFWFS
jgi:hypothetical protein